MSAIVNIVAGLALAFCIAGPAVVFVVAPLFGIPVPWWLAWMA